MFTLREEKPAGIDVRFISAQVPFSSKPPTAFDLVILEG